MMGLSNITRSNITRAWQHHVRHGVVLMGLVVASGWLTGPSAADSAVPTTPVTASASAPVFLPPEAGSGWTPKPLWQGSRHAVAAAHPLAAEAGDAVLAEGGSAVDAAIAVQMVLTLVEPQSSGIGGGAFLLFTNGQETWAYDGRETAPAGVNERLFLQDDGQSLPFADAVASGLSVGVPGVLPMLELTHQRHGRLPWSRLIEPAIALSEQGFEVTPRLHTLLQNDPHLRRDPVASAYFLDAQGQPWPVGHRLRNPALADTLRCVAAEGARCLTHGPIAEAIVDRVRHHPQRPGTLSLADLASYQPVVREPLCHPWAAAQRLLNICGFPPPSSGALAIGQILGTLAHLPPVTPFSDDELHRYVEASRLAFADRARYVADPAFVNAPGGDWVALLAPAYLRERARLIGHTAMPQAPAGEPAGTPLAWGLMPEQPERGTSHLSIVDAHGHVVAMTTTIESAFGARMMVHGFLLNNQLTDFSFQPADAQGRPIANRVEPGKRPRSSMSPTLVFDATTGELLASLGSPGGALIIHYTARALLATQAWGHDPQTATEQPHIGSLGGPALIEAGRFPAATRAALQARGHDVRETPMTSGLHILQRHHGLWLGGADPRREGVVRGE